MARDRQGALARGAVSVNGHAEQLYALIPPRLFGGEPVGGAAVPIMHAAGLGWEERKEGDGDVGQEPGWTDPAVENALVEIVVDLGQRPRAKLQGRREPRYLHSDPSVVGWDGVFDRIE